MLHIRMSVANYILAFVVLAFAVVMYVDSLSIPPSRIPGYPGAAFFPRMVLIFIALMSVGLLARQFFSKSADANPAGTEEEITEFELSDLAVTSVVFLAYAFGLDTIGFEITNTVVLGGIIGVRTGRWLLAAVTGVLSSLVFYVLFVVAMDVDLPLLFLPRYLFY